MISLPRMQKCRLCHHIAAFWQSVCVREALTYTIDLLIQSVALLMPELAEGLGPVSKRNPIQQQYNHVLRMDHKMRDTVRQIPAFLLREGATEQFNAPWLSIARRSLAITAADKVRVPDHRPSQSRDPNLLPNNADKPRLS